MAGIGANCTGNIGTVGSVDAVLDGCDTVFRQDILLYDVPAWHAARCNLGDRRKMSQTQAQLHQAKDLFARDSSAGIR
jgi:hypothetical protein